MNDFNIVGKELRRCNNLSIEEVVIPDGITHIGSGAFSGCTSLSSVIILNPKVKVHPDAFSNCNITYTNNLNIFNDTQSKIDYLYQIIKSNDERLTLNGKDIRRRKNALFLVIFFNDDVNALESMLKVCGKINIETLNQYIEQTVNAPKVHASLIEYRNEKYPPDKLNNLETIATEKELGLRKRTISDWKKIYSFKTCEEGIVLTSYKGTDIFVDIPSKIGNKPVVEIGEKCFSAGRYPYDNTPADILKPRKSIKTVCIPDSVKRIEDMAFYGCTSLETISISDSVTEIGWRTFSGCTSLKSITIPNSVKEFGWEAFENCTSLESITIPNSVKKISRGAFYGCTSLSSVTILNPKVKVDPIAFLDCNITYTNNLKIFHDTQSKIDYLYHIIKNNDESINLNEKDIRKHENALFLVIFFNDDVNALESMLKVCGKIDIETLNQYIEQTVNAPKVHASLIEYKNKEFPPDKLDYLETIAAEKELGLRKRTISDWKKIYSFKTYKEGIVLTSYKGTDTFVDIPSKIGNKPVVAIGGKCFIAVYVPSDKTPADILEPRKSIKSVNIPDSVKRIEYLAFSGCTSLKSITIPNSVIKLGVGVFKDCTSLESITIPNSVEEIWFKAFSGCTSLKSITIPNSVEYIGNNTFENCTSLESITIPNSVTGINEKAFSSYKGVTFRVQKDSYALSFFKQLGKGNIEIIE